MLIYSWVYPRLASVQKIPLLACSVCLKSLLLKFSCVIALGSLALLNATLILSKLEVAAYWKESRYYNNDGTKYICRIPFHITYVWWEVSITGFADVFDVDHFIQRTKGICDIVMESPEEIASREQLRVDYSSCKGLFDYIETVLATLLERRYIFVLRQQWAKEETGIR